MAVALTKYGKKLLEDIASGPRGRLFVFAGTARHCHTAVGGLDMNAIHDDLKSRGLLAPVTFEVIYVTPHDIHTFRGYTPKEGDVCVWGHFDDPIPDSFRAEIALRGFQ